ncbi:enoyl-ACP reductase FabI [Leucothrix pacifica]|uniref:Enoyl-[acyl-carrier-protein] reductase [NADH] n=1 Tax=Leucothrix pacifica TaxID=1247513 RepID=A0A317CDZ5_9GAMM|nr:enoyl-ACP reductase FabI [Leucothrix pacifica]PWQ96597.1 enoyl-[acyl-carrier-protein] reductase FabI [Leucothrix pacifica]
MNLLEGKKGLVVGIANRHSIAYGCAKAFHDAGAEIAITYVNEKAEPYVRPLGEGLDSPIIMPCDVEKEGELDAVFQKIEADWGKLDFVLHSIAFAPRDDLHGRITDCSRAGFLQAMNVSVYSFIEMARRAEPLMKQGGALLTVSYYGAEKVVDHYNLMGPVKSALEGTTRYLAAELGHKDIRVNALSPGPLSTRAASGINHFDELIDEARNRAPQRRLVTIEDVGNMAVGLASDQMKSVTGNIAYVDAGYHVMS